MFIYLSTHSATRFFCATHTQHSAAHICILCIAKSSQQQNNRKRITVCISFHKFCDSNFRCCCCWFRLHFTCYGNRLKRRMSIIVNGFECATRQFFIHSSPFPFFVCLSERFFQNDDWNWSGFCLCTLPLPPLLLLLFCRCRLLVLLLLFCVLKFLPPLFFAVIETTIYYLWYF